MSTTRIDDRTETLYRSLPALYRRRDLEQGQPLRALLAAVERELDAVASNIDQLHRDAFIETCAPWVVPYLAELVGVRVIGDADLAGVPPRTQVARAFSYRDGKGTPLVLERLVRDVLGWHGRVVEYFRYLARTVNVAFPPRDLDAPTADHPVAAPGGFYDVRLAPPPDPADPFAEPEAFRSVDVRRIGSAQGPLGQPTPNLPNLGLFLWRLASRRVEESPALAAAGSGVPAGAYLVDPLGFDIPLFARPVEPEAGERHSAEHELPAPIRRPQMAAAPELYYGPEGSLLVAVDGAPIPVGDVVVRDLADWSPDPALAPGELAVDPALGRLLFADPPASGDVRVTYCYGAVGRIGGGSYDRRPPAGSADEARFDSRAAVESGAAVLLTVGEGEDHPNLAAALAAWDGLGRPDAVIRLADDDRFAEALALTLPPGGSLTIEAADGARPVLVPPGFEVTGGGEDSRLVLDGLWIDAAVELAGELELVVRHSTLVPRAGRPSLLHADAEGGGDTDALRVEVLSSITGSLRLPRALEGLAVRDSILEGDSGVGESLPALLGAPLAEPLEMTAGPRLGVSWGGFEAEARLTGLPASPAEAAALLDAALDEALEGVDPGFDPSTDPGFDVVSLGRRLLVRPPAGESDLRFAGGSEIASALALTTPPARWIDGLLSGPHRPFRPFSLPRLRSLFGDLPERTLELQRSPRDLADAAALLTAALRAAGTEPAYAGARAEVLGGAASVLLVRPGVPGVAVAFEDADGSLASDLGLTVPPGRPVDGVLSETSPPLVFSGPLVDVTVGTASHTLELRGLPSDVASAATFLQAAFDQAAADLAAAALPGTDPDAAVLDAVTVSAQGSRLLVSPGDPADGVSFLDADAAAVATRLALGDPPAELVHGWLFPVPGSLSLTPPRVQATGMGGAATESAELTFAFAPTSLEGARSELERTLRTAGSLPAFREVEVYTAGSRLVIVPGGGESLSFAAAGGDPDTAVELGLTRAYAFTGALSTPLAPFPEMPSPELEVTLGGDTRTVLIPSYPYDPASAAEGLEEGLIGIGSGLSAFDEARVGLLGSGAGARLALVPGPTDGGGPASPEITGTLDDDETAEELALTSPPAVERTVYAGSELSPFPSLAARLSATLGGETRDVTLAGYPGTVSAAAAALEGGLRQADPSSAFRGARVLDLGSYLLALSGSSGQAVSFGPHADDADTVADLELDTASSRPVTGLLAAAVSPFPTLPRPTFSLSLGGGAATDVRLDTLPATPAAAETALSTALSAFGMAAVVERVDSGDRFLLQPTSPDLGVTVGAGADDGTSSPDGTTFEDLGYAAGSPDVRACLLSAAISPFPTFPNDPSDSLALEVTMGPDLSAATPVTITLANIPADITEAATEIEAALRGAGTGDPSFDDAVVEVVGGVRLLIRSGTEGDAIRVEDSATGTITDGASQLELDPGSARRGALSDDISAFTGLRFALAVDATLGTEGPLTARLADLPTTLEEARASLQAALRAASVSASFSGAVVTRFGDRLLVESGTAGESALLAEPASPAAGERGVAADFGLTAGEAVTGRLSGDLSAFAGLAVPSLQVRVQIGASAVRDLDLTGSAPPASLGELAARLESALQAAEPGNPAFAQARVGRLGEAVLVMPGEAGEAVVFTAHPSSPETLDLFGLATLTAAEALVSGSLPASFVLSAAARLEVTVDGGGPVTAVLRRRPTTLDEAAAALQEAVRRAGAGDVILSGFRATSSGARLVVEFPGAASFAFADHPTLAPIASLLGLTASQLTQGGLITALRLPDDAELRVNVGGTSSLVDLASGGPPPATPEAALALLDTELAPLGARVVADGEAFLVVPDDPTDGVSFEPESGDSVAARRSADQLGLLVPAARPLGGFAGGALPASTTLPGGGSLRVTLGDPAAVPGDPEPVTATVTLEALTGADRDEVRSALEAALRRASTATSFTGASVFLAGDRLLVTAADRAAAVVVEAVPGDAGTLFALAFDADSGGGASGGLAGGAPPFPALTVRPAFELAFDAEPSRTLWFSSLPTDRDELRIALLGALRTAAEETGDPRFAQAEVRDLTAAGAGAGAAGLLLITAGGSAGSVTVSETPGGPNTTVETGLAGGTSADGLLSGDLSAFTGLGRGPEVRVRIGTQGPYTARLSALPSTLPEAAASLQAAIRGASVHPSYRLASVSALSAAAGTSASPPPLERLLIQPGSPGAAVTFGVTPDDGDTLANLGLDILTPVAGLLGGEADPAAFTSLALQVSVAGGAAEEVALEAAPQSLAEAATRLEAALRTAPSAAEARVRILDDRLHVTVGEESVAFTPAPLAGGGAGGGGDDPTARRLALLPPAAVPAGGLLSGLTASPFPRLLAGRPLLRVTLGGDGPRTVALADVPATSQEARALLEQALRRAGDGLAFRQARVALVDDGGSERLVLVAGTDGEIAVEPHPDDADSADELGLDAGGASGVDLETVGVVLSGVLPERVRFTAASPALAVRMLPEASQVIADLSGLDPDPGDGFPGAALESLRARLEAEIRGGAPEDAFTGARVVLLAESGGGGRLLIVPGADPASPGGAEAEVDAAPGDDSTLVELALAPGRTVGPLGEVGPPLTIERSTVFGPLELEALPSASESLFTAPVRVERREEGCVRYSYLPSASAVPRTFRSQPALAVERSGVAALERRARELGLPSVDRLSPMERAEVLAAEGARVQARLTPRFTSRRFGEPAYGQLSPAAAEELRTGAEDGSEMGAFYHLREARRRRQLRGLVEEYVRFGLDVGFFEVT